MLPQPESFGRIRLFRVPKATATDAFSATEGGGARIEIRLAKPKPKDQAFVDQVAPPFAERITKEVATLRQLLAQQELPSGLVDEPAPPERLIHRPSDHAPGAQAH